MTLIPSTVPKERGSCRKEGATDSSRGGSIISQRHILIFGAGFLLLAKLPFQITHMNGIYRVSFFNTNHAFCFYQFHPAFVAIFSSFPSQHIHCEGFLDRKSREGNILNACNISVWYSSGNCRTRFQITSPLTVAFWDRVNCSAFTGRSAPISLLSEWGSIGKINNPLKLRLWHDLPASYKISFNKAVKSNLSSQ